MAHEKSSGDIIQQSSFARYALNRFPGHYLAHQVLATIEFHELRSDYTCDSALAWERLLQADNYNIQSVQLLQPLINLYQAQPDVQRARNLREQIWKRISHDEMVIKMAEDGRDLGEPRWYNDQEIEDLRQLMNQLDAMLATL